MVVTSEALGATSSGYWDISLAVSVPMYAVAMLLTRRHVPIAVCHDSSTDMPMRFE